MTLGDIEQRSAQRERRGEQPEHEFTLPHAIHRHVDVVARARRVQPPRHVVAADRDDEALDVEEQVLVGAVVGDRADFVLRDAVERRAQRMRVGAGDDALRVEHDQVRVVNRHQRREQELLGVFEVLVQDVGDIFRRESHQGKYIEFVRLTSAHL